MTIKKFSMNNIGLVLGLLLGVVILLSVGCSENADNPSANSETVANATQVSKEEQVRKRVKARWDALIALDWEKAYGFFSPGSRELKSFSAFRGHMLMAPIKRLSTEIKKIDCQEDVCQAEVELTYVYMGLVEAMRGEMSKSTVREKWLYSDGEWWYVDPSNH